MLPVTKPYTIGYRHGDRTFYGVKHRGVDLILPKGRKVRTPVSGHARAVRGTQGGLMVYLTFTHKGKTYVMRFLHLSAYKKLGKVRRGDVIGLVGNTGLSTGPHLHWDLRPAPFRLRPFSEFIDPLKSDMLKSMATNKELEKRIAKKNEKIRKLNTEIGRVTKERDSYRKQLQNEQHGHKETVEKYVAERKKREDCEQGKRILSSIITKIRNLI